MKISIPKETEQFEKRVAASPETVKKMVEAGLSVTLESGAGIASSFLDNAYLEAGAKIVCGLDSSELCGHCPDSTKKPAPKI